MKEDKAMWLQTIMEWNGCPVGKRFVTTTWAIIRAAKDRPYTVAWGPAQEKEPE